MSLLHCTRRGKPTLPVDLSHSGVRIVWIMGFQRDQFLRVTCMRASNDDVPVFSGECGARLTEAFGRFFRRVFMQQNCRLEN
jgi:hypothetical protein